MEYKEAYDKLIEDFKFKQYLKENPNAKLSHFFTMAENNIKLDWQIGFYNESTNLVAQFTVNSKEIIPEPLQEPFKKPEDKVGILDLEKVRVTYEEAIEKAKETLQEYPKASTNKALILLQSINNVNMWNITYLTMDVSTINIKINAINGEVISHQKQSLIQEEI